MSVYSPTYHAMVSSPGPRGGVEAVTVSGDKTPKADSGESFFHHVLDVINPLQHLPVVGSIYRAITGEHIGPVEKIAGDTLYGGLWGAVSSIADVAFESITGKSFEDTAMAWIKGDNTPAVASQKVVAPEIALNIPRPYPLPGHARRRVSRLPPQGEEQRLSPVRQGAPPHPRRSAQRPVRRSRRLP